MSTTIDERIASMKFDNSNFENNVRTTMSTLEKFNEKLKLTGATQGLNNINAAASKTDLSGMDKAIDAVQRKFSMMEIAGITAVANIANSAVNMGKKLVNAFAIAPITSGFQEYETKMNAIQTIMSNTASKGVTMSQVTQVLDELNTYADKTIYNFAEMTRNIGTFTAAGVGLNEAASAIQGIANLAAASGSSSMQASTAMYQLSQALATGTVKLMDWNSVVNAGMGGQKFQDALKQTAREQGVAVDAMIAKNGSFRDSLQEGWLSADILNNTLNKFTVDGAQKYADAMVKSGKYTLEQAEALVKEAQSMEDAATKVKTFTQLLDTLKEAAQSGWGRTWEIIIGNFEEAKILFSSLSDIFGNMIGKSADARNNLLAETLSSKWDIFLGKAKLAGISTDVLTTKITEMAKAQGIDVEGMIKKYGSLAEAIDHGVMPANVFTKALRAISDTTVETVDQTSSLTTKMVDFQKVVDEVWNGTYKNGTDRIAELTQAGYDYASVQALVNTTEDGHRLTLEELSQAQLTSVAMTQKLSDEQLVSIGFTGDQIKSIRDLADQAEKTGTPMNKLIDSMTRPTGRALVVETLLNTIKAIVKPLNAVKKALDQVFGIKPGELYNVIGALQELSKHLIISDDAANNITRTFSGVFSVAKLLADVIVGVLSFGFKLLMPLVGGTSGKLLEVTGSAGDAITKFKDMVEASDIIGISLNKAADFAHGLAVKFLEIVDAAYQLPLVQGIVKAIQNGLSNLYDVGSNTILGLKNGIVDGSKTLPDIMRQIGLDILNAIKKVLGIHSPSSEMHTAGSDAITSFTDGLKSSANTALSVAGKLGSAVLNTLKNIPWDTIFAGGITVGAITITKTLTDAVRAISRPAEGLGNLLDSTASVVKSFSHILDNFKKLQKAFAFSIKLEAIKGLIIALTILIAAIAIISFIPSDQLTNAIINVGMLGTILVGMVALITKLNTAGDVSVKGSLSAAKMGAMLIALSVTLLILAVAISIISKMNPTEAVTGFTTMAAVMLVLGLFLQAMAPVINDANDKNIKQFGKMMTKLAVALLLMVVAVKLAGCMEINEVIKGGLVMGAMCIMIYALVNIVKTIKSQGGESVLSDFGKMMTKLAIALLLMVVVIKILGNMSAGELIVGIMALTYMVALVETVLLVAKIPGATTGMDKVEKIFTTLGVALLLMAAAVRILGGMSVADICKGEIAVMMLLEMVIILIAELKTIEKEIPKVAGTILMISIAIGMLASTVAMLGMLSVANLVKGVVAVGLLALVVRELIIATKDAGKASAEILAISTSIAVIAASLIALSLVDAEKLIAPVAAIGTLMAMMTLVVKSIKGGISGGVAELTVMAIIIGELAGIIFTLSLLPVDKALASTASVSILLLSLAVAMKAISTSKGIDKQAIINMAIMGAVLLGLAGIIQILTSMDAKRAIASAVGLSALLLAICAAAVILEGVKTISVPAMASMAILTAIVFALSVIIKSMSDMKVDSVMTIAASLSILLLSLSAACLILAVVGAVALPAIVGVGVLAILIVALTGLMSSLGYLASKSAILQTFIEKSLPLLQLLGEGIGLFMGGIAEGIMIGVGAGLTQLGTDLSTFMTNLTPFINGAKTIDADVLSSMKNLAQIILILTAAELVNGIASFMGGSGDGFQEFIDKIKPIGQAMVDFSALVKGKIDPQSVTDAANGGKALSELCASLPRTGGWQKTMLGEKDLSLFSTNIERFGRAIVAFSDQVKGKIDPGSIQSAADCGNSISALVNSLPPTEGIKQWFMGNQDFSSFSLGLVTFGRAMVAFSDVVTGRVNNEMIPAVVTSGTALVELANKIQPMGSIFTFFTGASDLETFGLNLVAFGNSMVAFSDSVADGKVKTTALDAVTTSAGLLVALQNTLPKMGGLFSFLKADNGLDTFGSKLGQFGGGMATFSDSVVEINNVAIRSAVESAQGVANLFKSLEGFNTNGVGAFVSALTDIGNASLDSFVGIFTNGVGRVNAAATGLVGAMRNGISAGGTSVTGAMGTVMTNTVAVITQSSFGIRVAATAIVSNIADTIQNGAPKAKQASTTMMLGIAAAIIDGRTNINNVMTGLINSMCNTLRSSDGALRYIMSNIVYNMYVAATGGYSNMFSAGKYLVQGFANGISNYTYLSNSAARNMADQAYRAAMKQIQAKSPSRLFKKVGSYIPMGFAIGINKFSDLSTIASQKMAQSTVDATKNIMSRLATTVQDSSLDNYEPQIRPVVDLSNIKQGTVAIDSILAAKDDLALNMTYDNAQTQDAILKLTRAVDDLTTLNNNGDQRLVTSLDRLQNAMLGVRDQLSRQTIVMDTGAVVGSIITEVDNALGQLSVYNGRAII